MGNKNINTAVCDKHLKQAFKICRNSSHTPKDLTGLCC